MVDVSAQLAYKKMAHTLGRLPGDDKLEGAYRAMCALSRVLSVGHPADPQLIALIEKHVDAYSAKRATGRYIADAANLIDRVDGWPVPGVERFDSWLRFQM